MHQTTQHPYLRFSIWSLLLISAFWVIFASKLASAATTATILPPASQIIDSSGNVWTLNASNTILVNGSSATTHGWQTHQIVYYNNLIYIIGMNGAWYDWSGGTWNGVARDPQPSSPNGTTIPNASQIVDANGNIWTLNASGTILLNGSNTATSNWQAREILYTNNLIYILGMNNSWYDWSGGTWNGVGHSPLSSSPSGTTIPSAGQIVDAGGNVWTLNASGTILLNGSSTATSNWQASEMLYDNNLVYILGRNGHWYDWSGSGWNAVSGNPLTTAAPAACGAYASGTTYTLQTASTSGSTAATTAQCPNGGTQPTQIVTEQPYLCTNGVQTAQGSPTTTTSNNGSPTCNSVNGACGPANGSFTGFPTAALCASGSPTALVGTGPWTWACQGLAGGSNASCQANTLLWGVNISGGEYGSLPGTLNTSYIYPSTSEMNYYASKGLGIIRVPFLLERVEPEENGPLNASELASIDAVVSYANSKGMRVLLDPHNYGNAWGNMIGSAATPNSAFANFWQLLAQHYVNTPGVLFGLMNEPNAQTGEQWATSAQAAVVAIRSIGATQQILVPGTNWESGMNWDGNDNAAALQATIKDPLDNFAFEVHQYLDSDGSGTHFTPITDPNTGPERLAVVTAWAQQNGYKLFLGETGVPDDAQSLTALNNTLLYLQSNGSVWEGCTYWAGGPWWGTYPMTIEPTESSGVYVDQPQMGVLKNF